MITQRATITEDDMITDLKITEKERDCLVQCLADAHEALRLLPGVDENGPALVWLAEHLLHAHRRGEKPA